MRLPSAAPRKRGRPPKNVDPSVLAEQVAARRHPVGIADPLSTEERAKLTNAVSVLARVRMLDQVKRTELIDGLADAAALYRAVIDLQSKPSQKKGRKAALDTKTLLVDCARVWGQVTGKKPTVWQSDHHSTESVSVELARTVHESITGGKLPKNLKRQIADASKILKELPDSRANSDFF